MGREGSGVEGRRGGGRGQNKRQIEQVHRKKIRSRKDYLKLVILSNTFCGIIIMRDHTAKTQYRKFETNIPRKGIAKQQSQFPDSCVGERCIYSHDRSDYSAAGKYADQSWEYINRSQAHECGNWD